MTLLGQNVNSYRDLSQSSLPLSYGTQTHLSRGFSTIYHAKEGGRRFADLLEQVSLVRREEGQEKGEEMRKERSGGRRGGVRRGERRGERREGRKGA